MSTLQIRQRLEAVLEFMQPYWGFVNCHMVEFLTDRHWEQYVPAELRAEVNNVQQVNQCIDSIFWRTNEGNNFHGCTNFVAKCAQQRLDNFPEILKPVDEFLSTCAMRQSTRLSLGERMNDKKKHEVEVTAELIDALLQQPLSIDEKRKNVFVVDAGDGKGYLSSLLSLQYGYQVLGIDADELNTKNAQERNRKLQRAWNGLKTRAELKNVGITPPRRGKTRKLLGNVDNVGTTTHQSEKYKTTSKFIDSSLDIVELLKEFFPTPDLTVNSPPYICLTGLHTCGNLAATCLQLFHEQQHCKLICNIGCCYHLLKESFVGQEYFGEKVLKDGLKAWQSQRLERDAGFPMSRFLQHKCVKLGRNARMLAAQSIERTLVSKELPSISLYYRALLEVVICKHNAQLKGTVQVGKIRKFETFEEYVALCENKLQLGLLSLPSEMLQSIQQEHADDQYYLNLFYLLRMMFAPILESLILLDRLLYLKELGYTKSYLLSLFDPVISPRHFAIVSVKE